MNVATLASSPMADLELVVAFSAIAMVLLVGQLSAAAVLLSRLLRGPRRHRPLLPQVPTPELFGSASVVVPTLNEAARIDPCLWGLTRQSYELREVIVVDSYSEDGTPERVKAIAQSDPRFHLINDEPLPPDWVGRPWALHNGFWHISPASEWFVGMDADTQPQPGLLASLIQTARAQQYDLISLAPRFVLKTPGEIWLQPALLVTLVYRFGPVGTGEQTPERVMANGQCFLCRREVLAKLGGYIRAKGSFCDDVTLARQAAMAGYKVGFLDGTQVLKVRMYEGARETWREWGRSLDLKDASSPLQTWSDVAFLLAVQGLPLLLAIAGWVLWQAGYQTPTILAATALNGFLLAVRWGLQVGIASAYDLSAARSACLFWLSPLADPLAWVRIALSASRQPKQWRGRSYG
ncbi:2'-O-glycosyltransferase CruG [Geitlerinema sp. PCC 9228]|uniref:2'-O-glycosyltransferase CruG n=1 Tax=Geitlerinema sp. PCC 9228 TaxID=111611 RepID=UPI0008F9B732|nr:glycosyltransferase family 2 protein [Geitlerinema sp. PCC 9228]